MDGKDFAVRLKKIKAEILALKQSYRHGISTADFFHKNVTYHSSSEASEITLRCTIKYETGSNEMPFQILRYNYKEIIGSIWDGNTKEYVFVYTAYHYNVPDFGNHSVDVISTKPIESLTLEEIS